MISTLFWILIPYVLTYFILRWIKHHEDGSWVPLENIWILMLIPYVNLLVALIFLVAILYDEWNDNHPDFNFDDLILGKRKEKKK